VSRQAAYCLLSQAMGKAGVDDICLLTRLGDAERSRRTTRAGDRGGTRDSASEGLQAEDQAGAVAAANKSHETKKMRIFLPPPH
jgi:hypothetical protein